MDTFDKTTRSEIMRAVKSKGNISTEIALIKIFKAKKIIGWRRNINLVGRPDFAFPKLKIAVFADGCFWHGCSCRKKKPQANKEYWQKKIEKNKTRDKLINSELKKLGWTVFRIKECKIKNGILPKKFLEYFMLARQKKA